MDFRIKWGIWRVSGETKQEAARKLAAMLKRDAEFFFALEDASLYDSRKPLWRRLFHD